MTRSPLLLLLLVAAGCFPQVGPPVDAGSGGGLGGGAGGSGGGGAVQLSCTDGAKNGAESDLDCGGDCAPCALAASCSSSPDCESGVCTQARCVAPADACGAFAGCSTFVDLRDAGTATIRFPTSGNNRYSPECARVRFGQRVTFSGGDFSTHTLEQGCGPVRNVLRASSGQSATFTFDRALGVFGYYCTQHGSANGSGMAGAIEVVR